jgi:hypothetical protein
VSVISVEDYLKTAAFENLIPTTELAGKPASRLGRIAKFLKWPLIGAGALGAGALGAHLLSKKDEEEEEPAVGAMMPGLGDTAMRGLERGLGGTLTEGAKALGRAAYAGGRRLLQGRKHRQVFDQVSATDPILAEADPEELQQTYATMTRFAPTLASDPYAAQSFLREAVTSGGGISYNTLKLLAEAERAAQQI